MTILKAKWPSSFGPIVSSDVVCSCFKPVHSAISRAAKPSVLFRGWYREQETSMWSALCSSARICTSPRSPSPICALLSGTVQRQYVGGLNLTQEGLDRVISGGEGAGDGINVWSREVFSFIPYSTYNPPG